MTECRRCSECQNMSHHWFQDGGDYDPEVGEGPLPGEFACKHCDVRGEECEDCGGSGYGDVNESDFNDAPDNCSRCDGEGVVPCDALQENSNATGDHSPEGAFRTKPVTQL